MKKVIYIAAGAGALILACIGTVIPILPTTPLLLLALYCFTKSSEKLSRWLRGTALYKRYLAEYVQRKSLTVKQKISIQIFAGVMMIISLVLIDIWVLRIILLIAFAIHNYVFIFRIKTYKPESLENAQNAQVETKSNAFGRGDVVNEL